MKDKLRGLRRENSTKSLLTDFHIKNEASLSRKGSITSLKSLGKDILSPFRKKDVSENNCENENDSFEEGWLTIKSKKFGRRLSSIFDSRNTFYRLTYINQG